MGGQVKSQTLGRLGEVDDLLVHLRESGLFNGNRLLNTLIKKVYLLPKTYLTRKGNLQIRPGLLLSLISFFNTLAQLCFFLLQVLLFGLRHLNITPLTTANILTTLSGPNVDPALSLILKTSRARFHYNIAKEFDVLGKFSTTNSTGFGMLGHFRIVESDGRK